MAFRSLSNFITALEKEGELARIKIPVSPELEITEITDRIIKSGGKALLFENTGTEFPLLINLFGSEKRMCLSLGVNSLDDISRSIENLLKVLTGPKESLFDKIKLLPELSKVASWMPKKISGKGQCQEIIMKEPDLTKLPVLKCWPADGGPFITLPVVHTKDPETGLRNIGMYRMQIMGKDITGMHWHMHKGSAAHFRKYKESGEKMPVTVTLGGDPVYTYAATAPLPENIDEYVLAGFLRNKKVEMVKCLTNELEVPSDVDFVIEGYVDPAEDLVFEGPFGDHTGFYSLADYYPAFHVTCITHRKDAVYPATIVGIPPMEDGWIGKATERIFLAPIRMTAVPELTDMVMPEEGVFHNITIAKIRQSYPGQAFKVMNALWGAGQMMFNKILIVTGESVNISNYHDVLKSVSKNFDPLSSVHFGKGPLDVLDHSGRQFAYGSKIGIDATSHGTSAIAKEPVIDPERILKTEGVREINSSLAGSGLLVISIEKSRPKQVSEIIKAALQTGVIQNIPFIVVIDHPADVNDLRVVAWLAAGNIDPERDCTIFSEFSCIAIDGTRKTKELDGFTRDWPNILVMNDETIELVNNKWNKYNIGPFLPSPSLPFKPLVLNKTATF